jgi:hypothetical protein
MNSLVKFFPIGNYTGIRTNPIAKGIGSIEYNYDNNKNINGILIKSNGFKISNDKKIPLVIMIKYLADGTFISYNYNTSTKVTSTTKKGTWSTTDKSLILITNDVNNKLSKPKKSIVNRVGNIITVTSFHMIDDEYKLSSTEVLTGIDKTETKETMVGKNKNNNSNYILFQNILAIIIVLILIFYFIYLSK